jgi:hypothetical protein
MTLFIKQIVAGNDDAGAQQAITGDPFTNTLNVAQPAYQIGEGVSSPAATLHLDTTARFTDVTIPKGAIIDSATLTLTAFSSGQTGGNVFTNIVAHNVDNSPQLIQGNFAEYNGRALTGAVAWALNPIWVPESVNVSPDIKTVIQTIVDRPGWASGNALHIFVQESGASSNSERRAYGFVGNPAKSARLTVNFTAAVVGGSFSPGGTQQSYQQIAL